MQMTYGQELQEYLENSQHMSYGEFWKKLITAEMSSLCVKMMCGVNTPKAAGRTVYHYGM
jgi:pyruvate/oxaloacetate carboxyltransferase